MGFLLLDNPIKEVSHKIITQLKENNVECRMITGDNVFTGLNIG